MSRPLYEVENLAVAVHNPTADEDRTAGVNEAAEQAGETVHDKFRSLPTGWIEVITGMSFHVMPGEVLAFVGESGSGKTLSMLGSANLLSAGSMVVRGTTHFGGKRLQDIMEVPERTNRRRWRRIRKTMREVETDEWRELVGAGIGFLFQDPIGSWSPPYTVGNQAAEVLEEHFELTDEEIQERLEEALGEVMLPKRGLSAFSIEMSRGQAQRAMLAAALLSKPKLLIADEPLSGLDAAAGRAILELIKDLRRDRDMAMIMATHDLATVASIADRVAVMYAGRIVEQGLVDDIFHHPQHPYTAGLLGSIPWPGARRLRAIRGEPPELAYLPEGCSFAERCDHVRDVCRVGLPPEVRSGSSMVRCVRAHEIDLPGVGV